MSAIFLRKLFQMWRGRESNCLTTRVSKGRRCWEPDSTRSDSAHTPFLGNLTAEIVFLVGKHISVTGTNIL